MGNTMTIDDEYPWREREPVSPGEATEWIGLLTRRLQHLEGQLAIRRVDQLKSPALRQTITNERQLRSWRVGIKLSKATCAEDLQRVKGWLRANHDRLAEALRLETEIDLSRYPEELGLLYLASTQLNKQRKAHPEEFDEVFSRTLHAIEDYLRNNLVISL